MSKSGLKTLTLPQTVIYAGLGSVCDRLGRLRLKLLYGEALYPDDKNGCIDVLLHQLDNRKSSVEIAQCLRCGEDIFVLFNKDTLSFMVRHPDEEIREVAPDNAPPDWTSQWNEGWTVYPNNRGMGSYKVLSWFIKRIGILRDWVLRDSVKGELPFRKCVGCKMSEVSKGVPQDRDVYCLTCNERYRCEFDGRTVRLFLRCPLSFREAMCA